MMEQDDAVVVLDPVESDGMMELVPPPHYGQLRQLAEAAAGVDDGDALFFFRGETLERAGDRTPIQASDIVMPAHVKGRYPRNQVVLDVHEEEDPHTGYIAPVGIADAMFWSDAAVQKFLFPYVASCGGDNAAAVLTRLQQAWNFYPSTLTVYALVHLTAHRTDVPLGLEDSFVVVYGLVGSPVLQSMPLSAFVETFQVSTRVRPMAAVEVSCPAPDLTGATQRPNYQHLRAMAEWAASLRDGPQYFIFPADGSGFLPPVKELPELRVGDLVVPAFTPTVPAMRQPPRGVWFHAAGHEPRKNVAEKGDALFWSTGAVEQFVYPYYASKLGLDALPDLQRIDEAWNDTGVYAIIHLPSSMWTEEMAVVGTQTWWEQRRVQRVEPLRQLGVIHQHREHPRVTPMHRFLSGR